VSSAIVTAPSLGFASADATCPAGMIAVSGGYFMNSFDGNAPLVATESDRVQITNPEDTWRVDFYNPSGTQQAQAHSIAYCAAGL
jgi:hypothetical protein